MNAEYRQLEADIEIMTKAQDMWGKLAQMDPFQATGVCKQLGLIPDRPNAFLPANVILKMNDLDAKKAEIERRLLEIHSMC